MRTLLTMRNTGYFFLAIGQDWKNQRGSQWKNPEMLNILKTADHRAKGWKIGTHGPTNYICRIPFVSLSSAWGHLVHIAPQACVGLHWSVTFDYFSSVAKLPYHNVHKSTMEWLFCSCRKTSRWCKIQAIKNTYVLEYTLCLFSLTSAVSVGFCPNTETSFGHTRWHNIVCLPFSPALSRKVVHVFIWIVGWIVYMDWYILSWIWLNKDLA